MKIVFTLAIATVLCVCEGRHVSSQSKRSTDDRRSVMCLPDRKICYLVELEEELYNQLVNQEQSMLSWWRQNGVHVVDNDDDAVVIPRKWIRTDGPLETLGFLGKDMQNFVRGPTVERPSDDAELLLDDVPKVNSSEQTRSKRFIRDSWTSTLSCENSRVPIPRYGFTGTPAATTCDWLTWCENTNDLTDCKRRHRGNYVFYRCLCCPEHCIAGQCHFCYEQSP